jgi:hypothetical protein
MPLIVLMPLFTPFREIQLYVPAVITSILFVMPQFTVSEDDAVAAAPTPNAPAEPTCVLPAKVTTPLKLAAAAVIVPAKLLVVPTNRAFCVDIPPAVMIEPVVLDVASVTSVELMPAANGTRTVVVVCPSFVIAVDKPVARSAVSALNAVDEMTVPVTTGWPLEFI